MLPSAFPYLTPFDGPIGRRRATPEQRARQYFRMRPLATVVRPRTFLANASSRAAWQSMVRFWSVLCPMFLLAHIASAQFRVDLAKSGLCLGNDSPSFLAVYLEILRGRLAPISKISKHYFLALPKIGKAGLPDGGEVERTRPLPCGRLNDSLAFCRIKLLTVPVSSLRPLPSAHPSIAGSFACGTKSPPPEPRQIAGSRKYSTASCILSAVNPGGSLNVESYPQGNNLPNPFR